MDRFMEENRRPYTDVSTVESQRNDLIPEEFPDGPYGSDLRMESLGKSTPWRIDQRSSNRFDYENRALHAGMSREYPGEDEYDHAFPEVHDEP
ncbi:hypothetical protein [Paenibacillus sp. LPE1-1-1.1]|uniref:hypothetical protein n=1 Tax=Paenibacillaceae TaxID=186822 RepID=UPI0034320C7A